MLHDWDQPHCTLCRIHRHRQAAIERRKRKRQEEQTGSREKRRSDKVVLGWDDSDMSMQEEEEPAEPTQPAAAEWEEPPDEHSEAEGQPEGDTAPAPQPEGEQDKLITQAARSKILDRHKAQRRQERQKASAHQAQARQRVAKNLQNEQGDDVQDIEEAEVEAPSWLQPAQGGARHALRTVGGVFFCDRCGAVSAAHSSLFARACVGFVKPGSLSRLQRVRKGKCPLQLPQWPDGVHKTKIRAVKRVRDHAGQATGAAEGDQKKRREDSEAAKVGSRSGRDAAS